MGSVSGKLNNDDGKSFRSVTIMNKGYNRRALHAGSWYSDDEAILDAELSRYLAAASKDDPGDSNESSSSSLRAIICPHAGFSYSGPTAAYSYHHLERELAKKDSPIRHILVFHPSHKIYLDGCAISGAHTIETPLGDLPVDTHLRDEILELAAGSSTTTASFSVMDRRVDEDEHSGEMQYPFLAKVQKSACQQKGSTAMVPILPIMCGNISNSKESEFGSLLAEIVARPDVFSVVSTDFCHWGRRFSFQPTPPTCTTTPRTLEIFEFIQDLDKQGMRHIEMKEPKAFAKYLKETGNTICGRHAIQTWLNAVVYSENTVKDNGNSNGSANSGALNIEFNKYAQSSNVRSMRESSVSYASAVARASRPL